MTSVIFAGSSGEVNTTGSRTVTLNQTPLSTDVLVLIYSGGNTFAGMNVSGQATWGTPLGISNTGVSQFFALGTSPTGSSGDSITVTTTETTARVGTVDVYIVRGLTSVTLGTPVTAGTFGNTLAAPSQTANANDAVFGVARGKIGMTWPSAQTPSGAWTNASNNNINQSGYATPTATGSHTTTMSIPTPNVSIRISQVIVSGTAATSDVTGTVSATASAPTLSVAGTVAEPATTGTVAAVASSPTVSIAGTVTEPPTTITGTVTAAASAPTVSIAGDVSGPGGDVTGTVNATASAPTMALRGVSGSGDERVTFGIGIGLRITQRRTHTVDPRTNRPQLRLVVVDHDGTPIAELDRAVIGATEDEISADGGFTFTVRTNDPKAYHAMPRDGAQPPEVQVWRGGHLVGWFVVTTARRASEGAYTFSCAGLRWYYSKLHIDRRPKRTLFYNGDFAQGEKWWESVNWGDSPGVETPLNALIVSSDTSSSGKALRLANGGTDIMHHGFPVVRHKRQRRRFTQPASAGVPMKLTAFVRMMISTFTAPSLPGYAVKFLAASVADIATVVDIEEVSVASVQEAIDENTPRDRFHEFKLEIEIPANGIEHIVELRLAPPGAGVVVFEDVDVSPAEQLGFFSQDQATIIGDLSDAAQDPQYGKASLNIGRLTPATGVLRTREYEFVDHRTFADAMNEYPALHNGVEWDVDDTRTLRTYYPRQGSTSDVVLALGHTVANYDASVDLSRAANSVVVQGMSLQGVDRKERHAVDAARMGGVILEATVMADDETPLSELNEATAKALAEIGSPAPTLRVTCFPRWTSDLLDRLGKGDLARVIVKDGLIDVDGVYRVMRCTWDPDSDSMTYDLAREV